MEEYPEIRKRGQEGLPVSYEEEKEIYLRCPGCGTQYLLQEEETLLSSLVCIDCELIILLNLNRK